MKATTRRLISTVLMLSLILTLVIPAAFAATNIGASTASFPEGSPSATTTQYCNGYYFQFYDDGTNFGWRSSQTGTSWSVETTLFADTNSPNNGAGFAATCDPSGDVFITYVLSATTFAFRQGTTSVGAITWSFAAITLTCTHGGSVCRPLSIYCFDTTHCWIGNASNDGAHWWDEAWACQTSACSTVGNWADKNTNQHTVGVQSPIVVGLASNQNVADVTSNSAVSGTGLCFSTTSNGGTSWSAVHCGSNPVALNVFVDSCVSVSSTVYCAAAANSGGGFVYFSKFTQGGTSVTESTALSGTVSTSSGTSIATDGANMLVVTYRASATTISYIFSPDLGTTWSAAQTISSTETTATGYTTGPPNIQSIQKAAVWTANGQVRFGLTSLAKFNLTCDLKESGATAETQTYSGGSPLPSSGSCTSAGATTAITVVSPCTLTVTVATDGTNTRYRFNTSATSTTTQNIVCPSSSGTISPTIWNYYQLANTYGMSANGPVGYTKWDATFLVNLNGMFTGASIALTTFTLPQGQATNAPGPAIWADYNTNASTPFSFDDWQTTGTHSAMETTGGNTVPNFPYNHLSTTTTTTVTTTISSSASDYLWLLALPIALIIVVPVLKRRRF